MSERGPAGPPGRMPNPLWYAIAMVFVSVLLLAGAGVWYIGNRVEQAEAHAAANAELNSRKFCRIVVTLDDTYKRTPPTTETGRKLAEDMARLRRDLGC